MSSGKKAAIDNLTKAYILGAVEAGASQAEMRDKCHVSQPAISAMVKTAKEKKQQGLMPWMPAFWTGAAPAAPAAATASASASTPRAKKTAAAPKTPASSSKKRAIPANQEEEVPTPKRARSAGKGKEVDRGDTESTEEDEVAVKTESGQEDGEEDSEE